MYLTEIGGDKDRWMEMVLDHGMCW